MLGALLPGAQHLQNFHPLVVHFPLAFLPIAAILYLVAIVTGRDSLAWAGLGLLVLGTAAAAVAAGTGLYAEEGVMVARSVRAALLEWHERLMLTTVALNIVATAWAVLDRPLPRKGRFAFLLLLFVLTAILTRGADYGGRMVYGYNAGGSACGQPIEFTE